MFLCSTLHEAIKLVVKAQHCKNGHTAAVSPLVRSSTNLAKQSTGCAPSSRCFDEPSAFRIASSMYESASFLPLELATPVLD